VVDFGRLVWVVKCEVMLILMWLTLVDWFVLM